jgi:fatty-acyl-CoA synthase
MKTNTVDRTNEKVGARVQGTPTIHSLPLRRGNFSTLAEALDYAAKGKTGYNFYSGRGELYKALPYATLRSEAQVLARRLLSLGVSRGSRVALVADTDPDFVRFFFACQYAGLTPVPLPAVLQLSGREEYINQLERLLSSCQAKLAMATDEFLPFLTEAAVKTDIMFFGNPQFFDNLPESEIPLQPKDKTELAYLQYTSGSTRFPRGVMISQKAVLHNLSAIITHGVKVRAADRAVSWLPFFHDMGLVGLLLVPLACQISVDFLRTIDFAMRPRLWLKLMSENKGTISFSPPFGYELAARRLRESEVASYDLSNWRVAGVGAEIIRPETLEFFAQKLAPSGFNSRSFLACYGMAECSLAICFGPLDKGVQVDHVDTDQLAEQGKAVPLSPPFDMDADRYSTFVNCGILMPDYQAEIRDSAGRLLPERQCGSLFLRGPSVMSGYFGDLEATREVLTADGWLDTGDIAYQVGADIFITGRAKDMIIINGRNIWPQDIEYLAEIQPGIRTGDAMAFFIANTDGEELAVVMVECREKESQKRLDLSNRLQRQIYQELGIDCIIELVPRNTLARTTSGKPSRYASKNYYLKQIGAD